MKTRKSKHAKLHSQACLEANRGVGTDEGFTCTCEGLPCSNMKEFDAIMDGKPTHTPTPRHMPENEFKNRLSQGDFCSEDVENIVRAVNEYDRLKRIEEKAKLAVDCIETLQKRNDELLRAAKNASNVLAALITGDLNEIKEDSYALQLLRNAIAKAEGK